MERFDNNDASARPINLVALGDKLETCSLARLYVEQPSCATKGPLTSLSPSPTHPLPSKQPPRHLRPATATPTDQRSEEAQTPLSSHEGSQPAQNTWARLHEECQAHGAVPSPRSPNHWLAGRCRKWIPLWVFLAI